jgi:hypothetical protein
MIENPFMIVGGTLFSLEKYGHMHVLLPMQDEGDKEESCPSVMLISGKELL